MKAIYLYKGQLRLGKALMKGKYLELTFPESAYAASGILRLSRCRRTVVVQKFCVSF